MSSCIEAATWNKAYSDCQNLQQTIKGVGYVATGRRGLRGLGDANLLVTPVTYDPCAIAAQPSCQPRPPGLPAPKKIVKTPTTPVNTVVTAGFSHWGLLAAVLVGGVVIYKVSTRKSA